MYFPVGWPKVVNIPDLGQAKLRQIVCNRDKILFAVLSDDSLAIWFCKVSYFILHVIVYYKNIKKNSSRVSQLFSTEELLIHFKNLGQT